MCLHDTRVALTHISVIPSDHQKILSDLDACCHSLGFTIRPVKCFFFFWFLMVGRLLKRLSLLLVVVVHPAYTWASYSFSRIYNWSPLTTPVNSLVRAFWSSLPLSSGLIKLRFVVNTRYGFIIIPSLHFKLAVNPIFSSIIKKANSLVTKCIKVWLGLSLWLQWQYYITLRF